MAKKKAHDYKGSRSTTTTAHKRKESAQAQQLLHTRAVSRPRRKARIEILASEHPPTQAAQRKSHASKADRELSTKPATANPKPTRTSSPKPSARPLSALDAAAKVLASLAGKDAVGGLTVTELVERMSSANLWKSPGGKTPAATLYAAISREIASKGPASRFRKTGPGHFAIAASTPAFAESARSSGGKSMAATAQPSASSTKTTVDTGLRNARGACGARGGSR